MSQRNQLHHKTLSISNSNNGELEKINKSVKNSLILSSQVSECGLLINLGTMFTSFTSNLVEEDASKYNLASIAL